MYADERKILMMPYKAGKCGPGEFQGVLGSPATEAVQQLQRDGLLQDTQIIFLSAMARTKDVQAGLALGRDYLTKPSSSQDLLARVDTILRAA